MIKLCTHSTEQIKGAKVTPMTHRTALMDYTVSGHADMIADNVQLSTLKTDNKQ